MKHVPLAAAGVAQLLLVGSVMAIDLDPMWDFGKPELSEQRFRAALDGADANDRLILQTQIARSHGLRKQFAKAQEILIACQPQLSGASAEARTRHALEWGRTWSSAAHAPESQTPQARETARAAYLDAPADREGRGARRPGHRCDPHAGLRRHRRRGPAEVGP